MKIFFALLVSLASFGIAEAQRKTSRGGMFAAASAQVGVKRLTGTYRSKFGEIKVAALDAKRLRVGVEATYPYRTPNGETTANMGTAEGEATMEGNNVAVFVPQEFQSCRITLKFAGNKLIVTQKGTDVECGFGANVNASGTYTKRSSRAPKFEQR